MFLLRLLLYTKTSESWFPLSLISRVLRLNPSQSSNAMIAAMIDAIADMVSSGEAFALFFVVDAIKSVRLKSIVAFFQSYQWPC